MRHAYFGFVFGMALATSAIEQAVATPPKVIMPVGTLANRLISGTVFEDRNYSGGTGRPLTGTPGAAGVAGARIEIFNAAGVFIGTTTTAAGGTWSFSVPENASYTVRVVSSTVASGRSFAASSTGTPLGVPTFVNGDLNRVGGENPARTDAGAATTVGSTTLASLNTATTVAQTISTVVVNTADVSGIEFGFSFNVITNTNDSGQGSLRQFMANANRLANTGLAIGSTSERDVSVFMIPGGVAVPGLRAALPSQLTAGRAVITVGSTPLPTLVDAGTVIDGSTQTANVGDTNAGNAAGHVVGSAAGTSVGIGPDGVAGTGDEYPLPGTLAPEIEIVGPGGADLTGSNQVGIQLNGADMRIAGLAVRGFSGRDLWVNTGTGRNANNLVVENNLFGSTATGLTDPTGNNRSRRSIELLGSAAGVAIRNNVIAYIRLGGILVDGTAFNQVTIEGNEIQNVGLNATNDGQGILLRGGFADAVVRRNLITIPSTAGDQALEVRLSGNSSGTSSVVGAPGLLVSENTLTSASGTGIYLDEQTAGAGGANPRTGTVTDNLIANNRNAGILLLAPQAQWLVAQNSTFANGTAGSGLALDLGPTAGVSINDSGDGDTGPNGVLNMPVFTTAIRRGTQLVLSGYARPGTAIELSLSTPDATGFGEGQTYLTTLTEGSGADADATTGSYSGTINGLNQGTDNTNRFEFTLTLPTGVTTGTVLTATGTLGGVTSEFAGNVIVNIEPDAVDDAAFTPAGVAVAVNVTTNDTDSDGTIATATVDLDPTTAVREATLTTAAGTYTANASGVVNFAPAGGYTGTAVLPYLVRDNLAAASDVATLTVFVGPQVANDIATTTSDQDITITVLANDVDVDGLDPATVDLDPATVGIQTTLTISGQGTAVVDASGAVIFTPLINYAGPVSFPYTVEDLTGSVSVSATVSITVTSAPPVANADAAQTPAGVPVTFSLTDNDADPDGTVNLATVDLDPVTAGQQTSVVVSGQGTFAADNAGNVTFSPVNGFTGTATASYTIRDNNGVLALNPATITVNVGPITNPDAATTGASVAVVVNVATNDTDANGLNLGSIDLDPVTAGQQGTLTVSGQGTFAIDNAGNVTFTPTGTFTGSTAIQYTIADVTGATSLPAILTITSTNQAPLAVDDALQTGANVTATINVLANDSDPDGGLDPTTVDLDPATAGIQTSRSISGQGAYTVNSAGVVTFVPTSNYTGNTSINYTVNDLTTAVSNIATLLVNIGPRAIADVVTTNYAVAASVNVTTNDIDANGIDPATVDLDPATVGQQTTFTVPNRGTFSVNALGLVTFTPAAGVTSVGTAVVSYSVADVTGAISAPVTFTVTTTTTAPVAVSDVLLLPPNTPSTINLVANDTDADGTVEPATLDLNNSSSNQQTTRTITGQGVFAVDAAGVTTFTPTTGFTGSTTPFTYSVRDNTGGLSNTTATITVYLGPAAANDAASTPANTTIQFGVGAIASITANDIDANGLDLNTLDLDLSTPGVQRTVTQTGIGSWAYNQTSGVLTFNPVTAFRGLATIQYRLFDSGGANAAPSSVATVSVLVDAVQPLALPDSMYVTPNITAATSATVRITNNDLATAPATLVRGSVDLDPFTTGRQAGPVTIAGEGTWTLTSTGGNAGDLRFSPVTGFTGTSQLSYTVNDNATPAGVSNVTTVRAFVGPIPTNDNTTTAYNAAVSFNITTNDTDVNGIDPTTVDLNPGVAGVQNTLTVTGGTFTVNASGVVTFTPTGTFVGNATATYTVRDVTGAISNANNLSTNGTITVVVTTLAPVATNDTGQTPPNSVSAGLPVVSLTIPVLTNDTDPDGTIAVNSVDLIPNNGGGDPIDRSVTTGSGVWTASATTGIVTFVPANDVTANTSRNYTIRDQTGTISAEGTIRALIGPIARDNVAATSGTTAVTVNVLSNDTDSDGLDNTTVDLDPTTPGQQTTRTIAAGTFAVVTVGGQNGRIRFTPSAGFTGTATVSYTVNDNDGATSNVATLFVTVATNPVAQNDNVSTPPNTAVTFNPLSNDNSIDGSGLNLTSVDLDPNTAGQQLTFTVAGQGVYTVSNVTGLVTFTPDLDYTGTSTGATYTVNNNSGLTSNAATLTVRVGPLANPDVASVVPNVTNANGSVLFNIINNDVDVNGVALNRSDLDPVTAGRQTDITVAQGRWRVDNIGRARFNPAVGFTGTATFPYVTQDLTGALSSAGLLTVNVGPITVNDATTTGYSTPITFNVTGNDIDANGVDAATVDLDPATPGTQTSRIVTGRGIFTVNATGNVTYTPTSTYIGTTTIAYRVLDITGALSTQATISVATTTSAPVAVNDVSFTPANTAVQTAILANDSDADGTLNAGSVDLNQATTGRQNQFVVAGEGTFSVSNAGIMTFNPVAGFTGTSQVNYLVRDNTNTASNVATLTVNVGPLTANETSSTASNTPVSTNVLTNDVDANGIDVTSVDLDPLTAGRQTTLTRAGQGVFTVDNAGVVTFTPDLNFTNVSFVTYTVLDMTGATSTVGRWTVNVGPVAVNDAVTISYTAPSVAVNVTTNDTDASGLNRASVDLDPATAGIQTSFTVAGQGTFSVTGTGGVVTFVPTGSFAGSTVAQYTVADNQSNRSNVATFTVTTTTVAPVANANNVVTAPVTPVTVNIVANDTDADGTIAATTVDLDPSTPLSQEATRTVVGEGTYNVSGGVLTFTPVAGYTGTSSISYTVRDNAGAVSNAAAVTVRVGPLTANDAVTIFSNATTPITILANDVDANGLDVATVDLDPTTPLTRETSLVVSGGTFTVNSSGVVTFVPTTNFVGVATATYALLDLTGAPSSVGTITVTINTQPPVAVNDDRSTPSNTVVTFSAVANDTDADGTVNPATLDFNPGLAGQQTSAVLTGQGTFSVDNAGNVTFTPTLNYTGVASVTYTVQDNTGAVSNVATITVDVGPIARNDAATILYNTTASLNILTNDTDAGGLQANSVDLDPSTPLTRETTRVVSGEGTFTVDASGLVSFTPLTNFTGVSNISYTVRDAGNAISNVATITVTVTNAAPSALADNVQTPANMAVTFNVTTNDGDSDGSIDVATVDLNPGVANIQNSRVVVGQGTYVVDALGVVTFTPDAGYTGTSQVQYTVRDNVGATSNVAQITVRVGPIAGTDQSDTPSNTNVSFSLVGNDTDVNGLTAASIDLDPSTPLTRETTRTVPGEGTFSVTNAGLVTFAPATNFTGTSTIDYTIDDVTAARSNVALIIVRVGPVVRPDVLTTVYNAATPAYPLLANDEDTDGIDPTTLDLNPGVAGVQTTRTVTGQGTFVYNPTTQTVVFTPSGTYAGTTTITYTVLDSLGVRSNAGSLTVNITTTPPVALDNSALTAPVTPVGVPILANDNDLDGSINQATIDLDPVVTGRQTTVTIPGEGQFVADNTGVVTFTPASGFTGTSQVPYIVRDNTNTASNVASITVTVGPLTQPDDAVTTVNMAVQIRVLDNDIDANGIAATTVDLDPSSPLTNETTRTVSGQGTFVVNSAGVVTFTPLAGFTGTSIISYSVEDVPGAPSNVSALTVHVGPLTSNDSGQSLNGQPITLTVLGNDADQDGFDRATLDLDPSTPNAIDETLSVPGEGVFQVNPDGTVTFTPAPNFVGGPVVVPYVMADVFGAPSNQSTITINVAPYADVVTTMSGDTYAPGGGSVTYTVSTVNNGPSAAQGVVVRVQLMPNLYTPSGALFSVPGAAYDPDLGTLVFTAIPVLANGQTVNRSFTFRMPNTGFASGTGSSTAAGLAAGGTSDPDVFNNNGTQNPATVTTIGPLPVELTRFEARARSVDAVLVWATATEKAAAFFAVERSLDGGRTFTEIGRRTAAGTTNLPQEYTLTDAGVGRTAGTVYYRLRQVDTDGAFTLSDMRTVTFTGKTVAGIVSAYPNPMVAALTVDLGQLETGTYGVTLFDATGRRVLEASQAGGTRRVLDVQPLPVGTYLLRVTGDHGFTATQRVVKE